MRWPSPFSRLQIRDRKGRTLVSVTLGYQRRRAGEGRSVARVTLTLTPGKGSRAYQEQQAMWKAGWVLSKMPVLMTGARPIPKSFQELQQAINARAAAPPVTAWRPEVTIWLRPVRYCEPLPRRRRRSRAAPNARAAAVSPAPPAHGRPTAENGRRLAARTGWIEKLLGLFRRKRHEPERPEPPETPARGWMRRHCSRQPLRTASSARGTGRISVRFLITPSVQLLYLLRAAAALGIDDCRLTIAD